MYQQPKEVEEWFTPQVSPCFCGSLFVLLVSVLVLGFTGQPPPVTTFMSALH